MKLEVKVNLPPGLEAMTSALVEVADNQKRIEALHLANQQLLASVAQKLLEASTPTAITPASPPAALGSGDKERAMFERQLSYLGGQEEGDTTEVQRRVATETWQRILSVEPDPQLPMLWLKDGMIYLSWNYEQAGASVHIGPDGKIEWYFKDNQTGALVGSEADPVDEVPPMFFTLMRAFRRSAVHQAA